jgi:predicted ArsR family transcriptional regulator
MTDQLPGDDLDRVGSLAEPTRRALYEYIASQPEPCGREAAAAAVGVPLHSAKFHLDRLVEEGLLEVEYRRLSGKTGPGAGRPSKLYRRSAVEVEVSIPPRQYDLAGEILAAAIERATATGTRVDEAVADCAHEAGTRLGQQDQDSSAAGLERLAQVLAPHGYEPRVSGREMMLANCPFDRLARAHTSLVCSMNLAFVQGTVEGLGCHGVHPRLDPTPDACCVRAHENDEAEVPAAGADSVASDARSARGRR